MKHFKFFSFVVFYLSFLANTSFAKAESAVVPASSASAADQTASPIKAGASLSGLQEVTGTVRLIRSSPETEVFFKDLKNSVIIPKTSSKHNLIFAACEKSLQKGTPVKLLIDPISRQARGLPDEVSAPKESSQSTGFKEIPDDGAK